MAAPTVSFSVTDIEVEELTDTALDLSSLNLADLDNDITEITFSVANGTLVADNDFFWTVFINGSHTDTLTISGAQDQILAFLGEMNAIFYSGGAVFAGDDADLLTVTVTDGNVDTDFATVNIDAVAQGGGFNNPPTVFLLPGDLDVVMETASNLDLSSVIFDDPEDAPLTVTLTASSGILEASSGGNVTVNGSGTDTLTLTGLDTDINAFLDTVSNVQYTGANGIHGAGAATIAVTGDDGTDLANLGTITLNIASPSDPLVGGAIPSDLSVEQETASAIDLSGLAFSDPTDDELTVTLTVQNGVLSATTDGTVTVGGSGTDTLILTGTPDEINTFLDDNQAVSYTGNAMVVGDDADTLTVQVADATSGDWTAATINIDVTSTNEDPEITGVPASQNVTNGVDTPLDLGSVVVLDTDSATVTVTITASAGTINAAASLGWDVASDRPNAQTLVLAGAPEDITAFLQVQWNVSFQHNSDGLVTIGFTVEDADGSGVIDAGSMSVTVGAAPVDTDPVVGGDFTGSVNEGNIGTVTTATGELTISDEDIGDDWTFDDVAATAGDNDYGTFELTNGVWTYTLDQSAVQNLAAGEEVTDTYTFTASDFVTEQTVTITITGTDDLPVIAVATTDTGNVQEDGTLVASGELTVSDVDTGGAAFLPVAAATNAYGTFTMDASGHWTFTLNNSAAAVQALGAGVTQNVSYDFYDASSQSFHTVTVAIAGAADGAVITGDITRGVTDTDATSDLVANGRLVATVGDTTEAWETVTNGVGTAGLGTFTMNGGTWAYNVTQAKANPLKAGEVVTDTFTFQTVGGSTQTVTVTVTGKEDASVISGVFTAAIKESDLKATGTLAITDVDTAGVHFLADGKAAQQGLYGSFKLEAGVWTYTLDASAGATMYSDKTYTDQTLFLASDGTSKQVSVTISGEGTAPGTGGGPVVTPPISVSDSTSGNLILQSVADSLGNSGTLQGSTVSVSVGNTGGNPITLDTTPVTSGGGNAVISLPNGGGSNLTVTSNSGGNTITLPPSSSKGDINYFVDSITAGTSDLTGVTVVQGGSSNDRVLLTGTSNTVFVGGAGSDHLTLSGSSGSHLVVAGSGSDIVMGGLGNDSVFGGGGSDSIYGGSGSGIYNGGVGNDTIIGGAGDDTIGGGKGDDLMIGEGGKDFIIFESGNDTATGGAGKDVFIMTHAKDDFDGSVVITDFEYGKDTLAFTTTGGLSMEQLTEDRVVSSTSSQVVLDLGGGHSLTINFANSDPFNPNDFHKMSTWINILTQH